jgi:hypothetical protein
MICLAVLAAISTQRSAGYSYATMKQLNDASFNQAQASDQWAFYQTKGIKQSNGGFCPLARPLVEIAEKLSRERGRWPNARIEGGKLLRPPRVHH